MAQPWQCISARNYCLKKYFLFRFCRVLVEMDILKKPILTSFDIQRSVSPWEENKILTQSLLQMNGRPWTLAVPSNGQPVFWLCSCMSQSFLFQLCSDPWKSYLQHLLCQTLVDQGGKALCRFQSGFHLRKAASKGLFLYRISNCIIFKPYQQQWAPDQRRLF